jgi:hypothetical protein
MTPEQIATAHSLHLGWEPGTPAGNGLNEQGFTGIYDGGGVNQ